MTRREGRESLLCLSSGSSTKGAQLLRFVGEMVKGFDFSDVHWGDFSRLAYADKSETAGINDVF